MAQRVDYLYTAVINDAEVLKALVRADKRARELGKQLDEIFGRGESAFTRTFQTLSKVSSRAFNDITRGADLSQQELARVAATVNRVAQELQETQGLNFGAIQPDKQEQRQRRDPRFKDIFAKELLRLDDELESLDRATTDFIRLAQAASNTGEAFETVVYSAQGLTETQIQYAKSVAATKYEIETLVAALNEESATYAQDIARINELQARLQGLENTRQDLINKTRAQAEAEKQAAADAANAAREQERAQREAAREATRAAREAAREQQRASQQAAREAANAAREQARAEQVAAREAARATAQAAREQQQAQAAAAREAEEAAKRQRQAQETAARLFIKNVGSIERVRQSMSQLLAKTGAVTIRFDQLEEEMDDNQRAVVRLIKSNRELVALYNRIGAQQPGGAVTFNQADFPIGAAEKYGNAVKGIGTKAGIAAGLTNALVNAGRQLASTLLRQLEQIGSEVIRVVNQFNLLKTSITEVLDIENPTETEKAFQEIRRISENLGVDVSGFASAFIPLIENFTQLEQLSTAAVGLKQLSTITGKTATNAEIVRSIAEGTSGDLRSIRQIFELTIVETDKLREGIQRSGVSGFIEELNLLLAGRGVNIDAFLNTVEGRSSQITEFIRSIYFEFGQEPNRALVDFLTDIQQFLQDNRSEIQQFARALGDSVAVFIDFAGERGLALLENINWNEAIDGARELGNIFLTIGEYASNAVDFIGAITGSDLFAGPKQALEIDEDQLKQAEAGFEELAETNARLLRESFGLSFEAAEALAANSTIGDKFAKAVDMAAAGASIGQIQEQLKLTNQEALGLQQILSQVIPGAAQETEQAVGRSFHPLSILVNDLNIIPKKILNVGRRLERAFNIKIPFLDKIENFLTGVRTKTDDLISRFGKMSDIIITVQKLYVIILEAIPQLIGGIVGGIAKLVETAVNFVITELNKIPGVNIDLINIDAEGAEKETERVVRALIGTDEKIQQLTSSIQEQEQAIRDRNEAFDEVLADPEVSAELPEFPDRSEEIEALSDEQAEIIRKRLEIERDFIDKTLELEIELEQKRIDIWTKYYDKLAELQRKYFDDVADANRKFERDEEDLAIDFRRKEEDAEDESRDKRLEIEKEYLRKLQELRRKFQFDAQEAIRANDAIAFLRLRRQLEFDKREARIRRDQQLEDVSETERQKREELAKEREREREDIEKDLARKLEDLRINLGNQMREARLAREQELRDLEIYEQRKIEELARSYQQQLDEFELYRIEKEEGVEASIEAELELIRRGNEQILNKENEFYDARIRSFEAFIREYEGLAGRLSRIQGAVGSVNGVPQTDRLRNLQATALNLARTAGVLSNELEERIQGADLAELLRIIADLRRATGGGGGGGLSGYRRFGGPVYPGMTYMVGEAGPELFVPDFKGQIVPLMDRTNFQLGLPYANGSTNVNNTQFNNTFSMLDPSTMSPAQIAMVQNLITQALLKVVNGV